MRVVVESRFRGTPEWTEAANVAFAQECCRFAFRRGAVPFASHLLYPGVLDDSKAYDRNLGISAGYLWGLLADEVWFFLRDGEEPSAGMLEAREFYARRGFRLRFFGYGGVNDFGEHLFHTTQPWPRRES